MNIPKNCQNCIYQHGLLVKLEDNQKSCCKIYPYTYKKSCQNCLTLENFYDIIQLENNMNEV